MTKEFEKEKTQSIHRYQNHFEKGNQSNRKYIKNKKNG